MAIPESETDSSIVFENVAFQKFLLSEPAFPNVFSKILKNEIFEETFALS